MSNEKQIEEMLAVVRNNTEACQTCIWYKEGLCMEDCELEEDNQKICTDLYNAGYRKQSEGEWKICSDGYYPYCSECKYEPKNGVMTNFCPNCGAKLKGGAE